jgi:hypothetical protein
MPAGTILVIVIGCVLIAIAAAIAVVLEVRLMVTRRRFGPEYERLASKVGHRQARTELVARSRRVAGLGIRPLDPGVRQELASSWTAAQEAFVEDPAGAVTAASGLVLRAAKERGYPADDREQLRADLSVHHARQLGGYRRAEEIAATPSASVPTEELRQALLCYRELFFELAGSAEPAPSTRPGLAQRPLSPKQPRGPQQSRRSRMPRLNRTPSPSQREGANQA